MRTTQDLQKTVKAIVQTMAPELNTHALSNMMVHIVTFFINTNEWDYLMKFTEKYVQNAAGLMYTSTIFLFHPRLYAIHCY